MVIPRCVDLVNVGTRGLCLFCVDPHAGGHTDKFHSEGFRPASSHSSKAGASASSSEYGCTNHRVNHKSQWDELRFVVVNKRDAVCMVFEPACDAMTRCVRKASEIEFLEIRRSVVLYVFVQLWVLADANKGDGSILSVRRRVCSQACWPGEAERYHGLH